MTNIDYDIKPGDADFLKHERELLAAIAECDARNTYLRNAGPDTLVRHKRQLLESIAYLNSA